MHGLHMNSNSNFYPILGFVTWVAVVTNDISTSKDHFFRNTYMRLLLKIGIGYQEA